MIKIMKYGQVPNSEIFARVSEKTDVEDTVSAILADVKENGDAALISYCQNLMMSTLKRVFPWKLPKKNLKKLLKLSDRD